jgi:hypothetical protein
MRPGRSSRPTDSLIGIETEMFLDCEETGLESVKRFPAMRKPTLAADPT